MGARPQGSGFLGTALDLLAVVILLGMTVGFFVALHKEPRMLLPAVGTAIAAWALFRIVERW